MALIPGSIGVGGMLAPTDTLNTYATYEDVYNAGGYRTVATVLAMQQIFRPRRKLGMMVYVVATQQAWILTTEPHPTYDPVTAGSNVGDTHVLPYATYGPANSTYVANTASYISGGGDTIAANVNATGDWTLFESGGGAGDYTNADPMELEIHGIATGSTFNAVPLPNMWDNLLYPITFTSFVIDGFTDYVLEAGVESIASNSKFEWSNLHDGLITGPNFTITAVTTPADLISNPTTLNSPTFSGGVYESGTSIFNAAGVTSAVDAMKEFKIETDSTGGLTITKSLKVYWRNPFYVGTIGFYGLGVLLKGDDANPSAAATTLAQLEANTTQAFGALYNDMAMTKYIKDPEPANYDYNVWHTAPTMTGTNSGWSGPSASADFKGVIMPQAYFAALAGGAFVAGTSSISVSFNIGGVITPGTLLNFFSGGTNIVFTEGGVNYIGFQTSAAIVMNGTMRIDSYNV